MMLTVYSLEQHNMWDQIVKSFQSYDIYWLSGYVKAFEIHGDGKPLLFYYKDEKTRGINVVMKRDIAKDKCFTTKIEEGKYFDFSTPYGYGGWIIEGDNIDNLFNSYEMWCCENGIISEFIRFHPIVGNQKQCSDFYDVVELGEVVHMDLKSKDDIWNNYSSKNRNVIRKAIKNNVKIYNGRYPEVFESFKTIYDSTMDKDDAEKYYYFELEFYQSILEDLPQNAQIFYAEYNGKIIAASIILAANRMMNYHLSGSVKEYGSLAPTNLLLYEAALWGYENGYKSFYLGGGVGSDEDSLFKFKRAFYRGELNHFYIGKKVYVRNRYEELVNIRGNINTSYFPKYRRI